MNDLSQYLKEELESSVSRYSSTIHNLHSKLLSLSPSDIVNASNSIEKSRERMDKICADIGKHLDLNLIPFTINDSLKRCDSEIARSIKGAIVRAIEYRKSDHATKEQMLSLKNAFEGDLNIYNFRYK